MSSNIFDNRLLISIIDSKKNEEERIPYSGPSGDIADSLILSDEDFKKRVKDANINSSTAKNISEKLSAARKDAIKKDYNLTQNALINPYAKIRLTGAIEKGESYLTDKAGVRPWYEESIDNSSSIKTGYSKYPTTSDIIKFCNAEIKGRTPYQFQDFVFCKWWNKIPNNRMITLRRYTNPVLDNLETIFQDNELDIKFSPIATAVTYFGEQTDNKLSEILKFSTGYKWGETSAGIWPVTKSGDGINSNTKNVMASGGSAFGTLGSQIFGGIGTALQALDILDDKVGDGLLEQGLPPDPYENGPYTNRIMGPVNRIDTVKKREAGLNFEMNGLKIKFDYVARPVGGINSKAVLLDILANFMLMGSASAIFFGGAHRFRIHGSRFPSMSQEGIRKIYQGDVVGGFTSIGEKFLKVGNNAIAKDGILSTMLDAGKELLGGLMDKLTPDFMKKDKSENDEQTNDGESAVDKAGKKLKKPFDGIINAGSEAIRASIPPQYLQGMRALLVGEPVGDWHLTIGNPLNPIAMIGNLICTNIEVEFDDDAGLGPDDFPLAFRVTVTLDHGMPRDKDAIESMFNKGNGRIYEANIKTSADSETTTDTETGKNNKNVGNIASGRAYATTKTKEQGFETVLTNSNNVPSVREPRLVSDNRMPTYYENEWTQKNIK